MAPNGHRPSIFDIGDLDGIVTEDPNLKTKAIDTHALDGMTQEIAWRQKRAAIEMAHSPMAKAKPLSVRRPLGKGFQKTKLNLNAIDSKMEKTFGKLTAPKKEEGTIPPPPKIQLVYPLRRRRRMLLGDD